MAIRFFQIVGKRFPRKKGMVLHKSMRNRKVLRKRCFHFWKETQNI